jgi:cell division transport system permease protein
MGVFMKFIKHHVSLIFPLIAILLGLEFFIVFDRTTDSFEKSLKNNYSMIVIAKQEMSIDDFKSWDDHIEEVREKKYDTLLKSMDVDESLQASLPFAYSLKLNEYLTLEELEIVKENLKKSGNFTSIENFQSSYQSKYELFSFIKFAFQTFILFMSIIGFFLIVKQMEVWNFLHADRMKVMEIFGASLFLRSKVLINMALIDAIISAIITSAIFYAIQNLWIRGSQMEILKDNVDVVFSYTDVLILLFAAIFVVMVAVYLVVVNVKEE